MEWWTPGKGHSFVVIPRTLLSKIFDPGVIRSDGTLDMVAIIVHCGPLVHDHSLFIEAIDSGCRLSTTTLS
jgi:hypothetical protein